MAACGLAGQRLAVLAGSKRRQEAQGDFDRAAATEQADEIGLAGLARRPAEFGRVAAIVDRHRLDGQRQRRVFGELEQAGAEGQQAGAVADRAFGKQAERLVAADRRFHRGQLLADRAAPVTLDEHGAILLAQPAHEGLIAEIVLGDERAVGRAGEHRDVEPADVIGDDQRRAGRCETRPCGPGRRQSSRFRAGSDAARARGRSCEQQGG